MGLEGCRPPDWQADRHSWSERQVDVSRHGKAQCSKFLSRPVGVEIREEDKGKVEKLGKGKRLE